MTGGFVMYGGGGRDQRARRLRRSDPGAAVSGWGGRRVTALRRDMAEQLPAPCWRCRRLITPGMAWTIGHIIEVDIAPELMWEPSNHRPEHQHCNFAAGARYGNRKRRRQRPAAPTSRDW